MRSQTLRGMLSPLLSSCIAATLAAQTPTGRLEGTVTDSLRDAPFAGAVVTATRLDSASSRPIAATADRDGRYLLESLLPGRYTVSFSSPLLDSLEFGGTSKTADIKGGQTTRTDLAVPSSRTLRSLACPGAGLARWTGALLGVISDAESHRPLAGAELTVSWSEFALDSSRIEVKPVTRSERVTTNASGQYRLCGLPTDERLSVQIRHDGVSGAVRPFTVDDDVGVLVRNMAFRMRPIDPTGDRAPIAPIAPIVVQRETVGRATLVGRVARTDGQPVAGAQVRIASSTESARSDERGEFVLGGLPDGEQELEVRSLGYNVARRPVQLREGQIVRENVALERVVSLDSVRVVAHRVKYPEFERNRMQFRHGTFLDADEIARRGRRTLPLLLTSTGDFQLMPMSRGRLGVQSQHLRRCIQGEAGTERIDPLNIVIDNMEHMDITDVYFPIIEAVEIYSDVDQAPMKYARACSVVVVWTRRSAKKPKPEAADGAQ
jgi:hypothetical protein